MSTGDTEAALYRLLYLCPGGGGVGVKAGPGPASWDVDVTT